MAYSLIHVAQAWGRRYQLLAMLKSSVEEEPWEILGELELCNSIILRDC